LFKLLLILDIVLAVGSDVTRVARGPLVALGRLSRALGASKVIAWLACSCCGGNKKSLALVAGTPDTLCCWLVCEFVTISGGEGQDLLLLGLLSGLFLLLLSSRLLLGVSGALFAALVFTLHTDLVVAVERTAFVAASVDAHANGLLYAWYQWSRSTCPEQVIWLECQTVSGEEGPGTLELHGIAVDDRGGVDGCGCRGLFDGGRSKVDCGSSRTTVWVISNESKHDLSVLTQ
jgi:hypothetical protein